MPIGYKDMAIEALIFNASFLLVFVLQKDLCFAGVEDSEKYTWVDH